MGFVIFRIIFAARVSTVYVLYLRKRNMIYTFLERSNKKKRLNYAGSLYATFFSTLFNIVFTTQIELILSLPHGLCS